MEVGEWSQTGGEGQSTLAPIRAVFFDAGGTILRVHPSVGHVYAEHARLGGFPVDPVQVNRAFRSAWRESLLRRSRAGYVTSDAILRDEWRTIVNSTFAGVIPNGSVDSVFEQLYAYFATAAPWRLEPDAVALFRRLRSAGIYVGLLSNWDSRLGVVLSELGVREEFDSVIVSHSIGLEKPHNAMFVAAERAACVSGSGVVIVGDSFEQDIVPAIARGWRALWIHDGECTALPPTARQVAHFESAARTLESWTAHESYR